MPLFEYECQDCGWVFEVFTQHRDQKGSPQCPECGTADVERILSAFSAPPSEVGGCGASASGFG